MVKGLYRNAESVRRETGSEGAPDGIWGICVAAAEGAAPEEVAHQMLYRGEWMRRSVLGHIRDKGFEVVMVDDPPHAVILLEAVILLKDEPTSDDWEGWDLLRLVFLPSEPNPAYG